MNGKGSRRRPCDEKKVGDNWDRIFTKPDKVLDKLKAFTVTPEEIEHLAEQEKTQGESNER